MDSFFSEMVRFLMEGDRVLTLGGWFMFFWSEWKRDKQAAAHSEQLYQVTQGSNATHLAVEKVLEGVRENLRLMVGRADH
jgi:preprotein translocase subunit YajC